MSSSDNEHRMWIHEYGFMNYLCKWHENVIPCADVIIIITTSLTLSWVNSSTAIIKGIQGYPLAFDFSVAMGSLFNSFGLWVLCILLTRKYEYNVIEMDLKHLWCDIDRLKFSPWWWLFINIVLLYPPYPKDRGMLWFYVEAARRPPPAMVLTR